MRTIRDPFMDALKRHAINPQELDIIFRFTRKKLGLSVPEPRRHIKKLPRLLTEAELKALFAAIDKGDVTKHQLMFRLLLYSGVRVSELINIKRDEVNLAGSSIRITMGKGGKDRQVPIPKAFALALRAYMLNARDGAEHLFESSHRRHYSSGMIRLLLREYSRDAGIKSVNPHLLRHHCLTRLCSEGLSDAQVQVISGHKSRDNLAIYQHLSLGNVQGDYQEAMRKVGV